MLVALILRGLPEINELEDFPACEGRLELRAGVVSQGSGVDGISCQWRRFLGGSRVSEGPEGIVESCSRKSAPVLQVAGLRAPISAAIAADSGPLPGAPPNRPPMKLLGAGFLRAPHLSPPRRTPSSWNIILSHSSRKPRFLASRSPAHRFGVYESGSASAAEVARDCPTSQQRWSYLPDAGQSRRQTDPRHPSVVSRA